MPLVSHAGGLNQDPAAVRRGLAEALVAHGGPVATLAGHYVLQADASVRGLAPVLPGPGATGPEVSRFPLASLDWGLDLIADTRARGLSNSLLLVVDDRKFVRQRSEEADPLWAAALRRDYFHRYTNGPDAYAARWTARGFKSEALLVENAVGDRDANSVLPAQTRLFSERTLRNRFEKHTRDELMRRQLVEEREAIPAGRPELFIRMPARAGSGRYCLTEDWSCGCGGEVAQLVIDLAAQGYRQFVLFVPLICFEAVAGGAVAARALLESRQPGSSPAVHILSEEGNFDRSGAVIRRLSLAGPET